MQKEYMSSSRNSGPCLGTLIIYNKDPKGDPTLENDLYTSARRCLRRNPFKAHVWNKEVTETDTKDS